MRLPLDLSNGGWHMPKSLNFRHVNRYSEDRTSRVGSLWDGTVDTFRRSTARSSTSEKLTEALPPRLMQMTHSMQFLTLLELIHCTAGHRRFRWLP